MANLLTSQQIKNKILVATGPVAVPIGSGAVDPTTSEVPNGTSIVWKNTANGEIRTWVNDGGTLKKSAAFT